MYPRDIQHNVKALFLVMSRIRSRTTRTVEEEGQKEKTKRRRIGDGEGEDSSSVLLLASSLSPSHVPPNDVLFIISMYIAS